MVNSNNDDSIGGTTDKAGTSEVSSLSADSRGDTAAPQAKDHPSGPGTTSEAEDAQFRRSGTGKEAMLTELGRDSIHEAAPSSVTQADAEPGFVHIDGDIGGTGYNDTKADVVVVSCPGADPVRTWTCDPLPEDYFDSPEYSELHHLPTVGKLAGDVILSPAIDRHHPKAGHTWVRQGIRRSVNTARVLIYRHRALAEGLTLESLARDLLDQVQKQRQDTVCETGVPFPSSPAPTANHSNSVPLDHCSSLPIALAAWWLSLHCCSQTSCPSTGRSSITAMAWYSLVSFLSSSW